ncbi:GTP cyclohydrolase I [Micromonospora sp. Llam7]|uniref:GTP cyclohydrolase I n=1 Tax=Micromonospora tarapacensis TaxID=2835305 RepID=UPI001C83551D|nr:GTP cyclohydrolase I [Micromonospora tarapacensis]MBX7269065.1 GTP cyclohydrolase I [Micromonospora tarapacensis]
MIDIEKVASSVSDLLLALGVERDSHTYDTPRRVAEAWAECLAGYDSDPVIHLDATFTGPSDPGLVVLSGIRLTSTCAHHLLPITGTATVAYRPRPGAPIVGLSKLARVLHGYARRLQVQEHIGYQVVEAIRQKLDPVGAACIITAEHGCISTRGVLERGVLTTTQAAAGEWKPGHADLQAILTEHAARSV